MRDELNHVVTLFNQDLAIFREALTALGTESAAELMKRLSGKGGGKFLLSQFDLTMVYNGMSLLEMKGRDQEASLEANRILRKTNSIAETHSWGSDPVQRFHNWQQFILARV